MLGLLLAAPAVALALPTTATLTGTVLGSNNDPCASCQVTIRTPFDQEVDGGTFPAEPIGTIYTTDADGEMPAGATATRGLWVEITVQYGTPNLAQIPDASTVDISTLILEPPTETPTSYVTDVWTCLSGNCNALTAATGDSLNATAADTTAPCKSGTTAPATCSVGQCFFDTDATAGSNLQVCTAADTWTTVSGGGGSGDITDVGDCSTGACFSGTSGNSLQFEGSTADGFETTVTATDPTADRTITLPNATGTVALERVYDVRAYGAKCDDSTNDAAAIQAAIDAAEAARSGVVQLPAGICVIGSGLTMDANNVTLRGEGAGTSNRSTMLSCNMTTGTCVTFGSSCTYCGVEDMAITARGTPTDLVLIDGTSASNDRVRNFTTSAGKYCTAIKNVQRVDHADLFGPVAGASCRGISVVDNAVYLHRVTGNWANDIEGMIVIEQTSTNIVDTVVISNTEIAQSGGAGAGLKFIGASTTDPPRWIQITNSLFEAKTTGATTGDYALYIDNVKEFKCTNCYFHGGYRAVVIDGGPGPIRFVNSEIGDSRREALYHNADVPTELIGTTVSDGGQETTNTYSGVYLTANSRQFTMIGGRASDDLFFSGSGQKYGIEVISGADEYRFDNVGCEGNDTACAVGLSTAATQAAFTDGTAYADSDWSNYVLLRAPSLSANWILTLPTDDGNSGQFLQTDGSGTTTWATPSGSGNVSNTGTPADNQVAVWTDATTIEGTSGLTFSAGTLTATTFSGALTGNASTATALASNPSDCAADTYATTIAASGNLTCASITNASTTGTALNTPSTLVLRDGSGDFAAGTITAALTGNSSTATALASNPSDCASDTYATTIAANGNLTCATVTNAGLAGSIAMSKTLLTADAGLVLSTNSLATASAETGFVTGSTSLPGTCGEGAVYQDTDSGGTETYVCTATNTWTKLVAATDNVATATALAANPSDCGADTYATTIAANGNLTCSTVTNAGLAGSIAVSKTLLTADAGVALSGNSLTTASGEQGFLAAGALTCGASTNGKMQVHTTPLQYCDNAATPTLQYAAYGNSSGESTAAANSSVALSSDTTGNYVATVAGTSNEISVSGSGSNNAAVTVSLPSTIDLGGKTSFEVPNGASPTTSAFGTIAGDNDAWAASRGAPQWFDGTANTYLVGTLASDTPTNGQVPKWNTGGTITWENDSTGSGGGGWSRDIVADYSAACDGSTDDSTELQNCIDAANTAGGGTCFVPATGTACVINADVTPKSNVNLICEPGAILQSGTGLTNAMLYATGAVNNWRISGCTFSNNGKELPILKLTAALASAGANWMIDHNQFYWDLDGGATPGTTAFSYISAVCGKNVAGGCVVSNNLFSGSATDAQNDSGIGVSGQGSASLFAADLVISDNVVSNMGASCITDPMSITSTFQGIISSNALYDCSDYGINLSAMSYSTVIGNVIAVDTSGAVGLNTSGGTNNVIDGNAFTVAISQGLSIAMVDADGTRISNNYAAAGIHMTNSSATGELQHPSVTNNVIAIGSCPDDPSDGGTLKACIYLENPTDASVLNNLMLGGFGTSGGSAIKLSNINTTASTTLGLAHISDNVIALDADATGTEACIAFDGSGSTTANFSGVTIANNTCFDPGDAQTIDYFVNLSSLADSNTNWQNVVYDANNATVTTFQNGGNTANVTPQFRSTSSGYIWEPKGFNDGFGFRSIHMMGDGNCVPAGGTGYLGPISTSGNNCSATETSVDWSVGLNPVTFTNMTCRQNEDTTCTVVFTLRDDASNTSATCTTTNNDTCAWSGSVTMAASSLAAISMTTNTSCTTESNVDCDLTYTVD